MKLRNPKPEYNDLWLCQFSVPVMKIHNEGNFKQNEGKFYKQRYECEVDGVRLKSALLSIVHGGDWSL